MFTALLVLSIVMLKECSHPICIATGIVGCIFGGVGIIAMLSIIISEFIAAVDRHW